MHIQSVKATENGDSWIVTLTDGVVVHVPQNIDNRHARHVQKWIDAGGTVDPVDPPPAPPTQDEEIDQMQAVFIAFLKAYAQREGVTLQQIRTAIKAQM